LLVLYFAFFPFRAILLNFVLVAVAISVSVIGMNSAKVANETNDETDPVLQQLKDERDVLQLIAQYSYTCDYLRDPSAFAELFVDDYVTVPSLYFQNTTYTGKPNIFDWINVTFSSVVSAGLITKHFHANHYFLDYQSEYSLPDNTVTPFSSGQTYTYVKLYSNVLFTLQRETQGLERGLSNATEPIYSSSGTYVRTFLKIPNQQLTSPRRPRPVTRSLASSSEGDDDDNGVDYTWYIVKQFYYDTTFPDISTI
jgi:hypothetical protein